MNIDDQIQKAILNIHDKKQKYADRNGFTNYKQHIEITEGQRYIKLIDVSDFGHGRSVYAFIDKTNGDILKPAGWAGPAKHARGNIFDESTWHCFGPTCVAYLR